MTNAQIQNELKEFALEDTAIAMESTSMAIAETKEGTITLNCNGGVFQAFNNLGLALTGPMNRDKMIGWLTTKYKVAI